MQAASEHGAERAEGDVARAEGDAERAERFFVEGRSAMKANRYEEACAKFAESHRLDPAPGALLNLAVCREAQGRTATAWTHYKAGLLLSQREAKPEGERFARERLQALEPTLCRLTIEPPVTGRSGLTITLDGARIEPATWGNPQPVDPGTHLVVASAPGRKSWVMRVSLVEQGSRRVLSVPSLAVVPSGASLRPSSSPPKDGAGLGWEVAIPGAVGVVGFASAGYFGLRAKSEWETRNEHCPGGVCDDNAVEAYERSITFARAANVSAAVGIVGAGVAAYFLVFRARKDAASGLPVNLRLAREHADVTIGGVF